MQSIEKFGAIKSIWFPQGWTILPQETKLAGEIVQKCFPQEHPEFSATIHLFNLALAGNQREALLKVFDFRKEEFSQKDLSELGVVVEDLGEKALFELLSARNGFLKDRRCLRIEGINKKKHQPKQTFLWSVDPNVSICQTLVIQGPKYLWELYLPEVAFATSTITWLEFPILQPDE